MPASLSNAAMIERSRSRVTSPTKAINLSWRQPSYKRWVFLVLSPNPLQVFKREENFTLLRLPINEIFNAIKDQSWVKRLKPFQYDPTLPRAKEYVPTTIVRHIEPSTTKPSKILGRTCLAKSSSKSSSLPLGQPLMQNSQALRPLINCST